MAALTVLHADTADTWRGGQAQIEALAKGLAARGHRQVLAAPPRGPLAGRVHALGIEVRPWGPRSDLDIPAAFALTAMAREIKPDIVHLHSARAHAVGVWAARATGAASVVARRVDFGVARHPLSALKYRLPVDRFVCVSAGIRDVLLRAGLPAERIAVIHSGIDVADVDAQAARARSEGRSRALRAAWGVDGDRVPLVGIVAALAPHKDHANFLDAAARVAAGRKDVRFVLAGDGPLAGAVDQKIRALGLGLGGCVVRAGFVKDVAAVLGALDVFVLSSYLEGLGTSVLDAQAAGVPVVATRVGGVPEMVEDGVTGLLVPARDPAALAEAILGVLADPVAAQARAARARGAVEAFDVQAMVAATEALYQELVASPGGSP